MSLYWCRDILKRHQETNHNIYVKATYIYAMETYERNIQNRHMRETYKRDVQKRPKETYICAIETYERDR